MKKILVPIDFSAASDNALNYAVKFAKKAGLEIALLNVYDYPMMPGSPMVWVPTVDELVEQHLEQLESIRVNIHKKYGEQLKIECYCEMGTVIETINTFVTKLHIDLIIMGLQGGGFISEKIIGSTATSLMRKSYCPVLGIARHLKYSPINQIALAADYEDADYKKILQPLKELIILFNAELFVLYAQDSTSKTDNDKPTDMRMAHALQGIPYHPEMTSGKDLSIAIERFVNDKAIDLVVIIPRKHSFFYSLFHESHTKKLAFHTRLPILALHE